MYSKKEFKIEGLESTWGSRGYVSGCWFPVLDMIEPPDLGNKFHVLERILDRRFPETLCEAVVAVVVKVFPVRLLVQNHLHVGKTRVDLSTVIRVICCLASPAL